jgi:hypothetical protein
MAVTGSTGGEESTPKKNIVIEGKIAPKLSVKARYKLADGKPFIPVDMRVDQDICFPPLSGDTPNWNIVGDNRIRKVFKIDVGNIPDDEVEDYIRKISEKFKKATQIQPDLDCGIYPDENELFLPTNIEKDMEKKMPEQPNLQKIHDALYPKSELSSRSTAHYMHTIPNSHFWTDLKQITYSIQLELSRQKREAELKLEKNTTNSVYVGEPLTRDYILIGLGNSLMHGYKFKLFSEYTLINTYVIFASIEDMIEYAQSDKFNLEDFSNMINNTINVGFNLTNGRKMERNDVYKRIDAERKYQDLRWSGDLRVGDVPDEEKPVAEWINYIEYHLSKAKDCNYHLKTNDALEEIRKVAALAVRAMEIHGCPERRMPDRIGNVKINPDGTTTKCTDNPKTQQMGDIKDNCEGNGRCDC